MKQLFIAIFLLPLACFSQATSTSEAEYNYLTEGIREQYSKGLDIKKDGYSLDKFYDSKSLSGDNIFTFSKLVDSQNRVKAISIIMKSPNSGPKDGIYYCLPIENEVLFKKYTKAIANNLAEKNIINATSNAMLFLLK